MRGGRRCLGLGARWRRLGLRRRSLSLSRLWSGRRRIGRCLSRLGMNQFLCIMSLLRLLRPTAALALDLVDRKLNQVTATVHKSFFDAIDTTPRVPARSFDECLEIFEHVPRPVSASPALLNDEEVDLLSQRGRIQAHALEKRLGDYERAVRVRLALISRASRTKTLEDSDIPFKDYAYERVFGVCCENVVGYISIPFSITGPLNIDGEPTPIPMATAEGTLVASTSRGCKALNAGGGVTTVITRDAMTRGPAIDFQIWARQQRRWRSSSRMKATWRYVQRLRIPAVSRG